MQKLHILSDTECIRIFPDRKGAKVPFIGHRTLRVGSRDWIEVISEAQAGGGGIFFSVNQTDGNGASAANIMRVRSYFVDVDDPSRYGLTKDDVLLDLMSAPIKPSAVVETRNGYHVYWYAKPGEPTDPDLFKQVEIGLVRRFRGDKSATDISRVLRVPGTYHLKDPDDNFLIEIIHQLPKGQCPYYSREELLAAYPAPPPKVYDVKIHDSPRAWENVLEDIERWGPVPGMRNRVLLVSAGVAISLGVDKDTFCGTIYDVVKDWPTGRDMWAEVNRVGRWAYDKGNPIHYKALENMGIPIRSNIFD